MQLLNLKLSAHEKKCISRGEALVPTTQSKLSRVSSGFGLSKLTGSRRNRKESGLHKHSPSPQVQGSLHDPWLVVRSPGSLCFI